MSSRTRFTTRRAVAVASAAALLTGVVAMADEMDPDVPVLSDPISRGGYAIQRIDDVGAAAPTRTVDGDPSDWVGTPAGFGGTLRQDRGELVYQDHLFDAYGADDGRDRERLERLGTLEPADKGVRRLELVQKYAAGEFGFPDQLADDEQYGNLRYQEAADLHSVHVAADAEDLRLLVRFVTMKPGVPAPALLLLADTVPASDPDGSIPFAGIASPAAERAVLITSADGLTIADLTSPGPPAGLVSVGGEPLVAVDDAAGGDPHENVLEVRVPWPALGLDGPRPLSLALGAGVAGGSGLADLDGDGQGDLLNVAFRSGETAEEPATWWDRRQALALLERTIDPFFVDVDPGALADPGLTELLAPEAGYHDRIFRSTDAISNEGGTQGRWQHYGLYLPAGYQAPYNTTGSISRPVQWWFHWRGGEAHTASTVIPDMFRQLGDDLDTIVVAPRGRGTSTWYVGRGHVDFEEVWDDVHALLASDIDRSREYVTGHSMGGWASWLLPILYPDRFAATAPFAGPVTMGGWTGADVSGCDDWQFDDYTPCYIEANGSRPRDQHTLRLLENLREVPVAVFQGAADELVPVTGVTLQVARLQQLEYRHRYYLSPTYEHYSHPLMDQWAEAGRYLHQFQRPETPARVSYVRDLDFEEAIEQVQSGGVPLDFTFDGAYWVSDLTVDESGGNRAAHIEALTGHHGLRVVGPDAGLPATPGQWGPFVVVGGRDMGTAPTSLFGDRVFVQLRGASTATLDLVGSGSMGRDGDPPTVVRLESDRAASVQLDLGVVPANWTVCNGTASLSGSTLTVALSASQTTGVIIDNDGSYDCAG